MDAVDERAKHLVREYVLDSGRCNIGRDDSSRCPEEEIAIAQRDLRRLHRAEEHLVRLRVKGLASPRVLENQLHELRLERAAIETRIAKAHLAREREVQRDAAQEDRMDMLAAARRLLSGNEERVAFATWRDLIQKVAGFLQPIRLMPNGTLKVG